MWTISDAIRWSCCNGDYINTGVEQYDQPLRKLFSMRSAPTNVKPIADAPFDGGTLLKISFDERMGIDNLFVESAGYRALLCTNKFRWSILMSCITRQLLVLSKQSRTFPEFGLVFYASTSGIQFTDVYEVFGTLLQLFHGCNRSLIVYTEHASCWHLWP